MNDPLRNAVRLVFGRFVSPSKIEALRSELREPRPGEELLVSAALPLTLRIEGGQRQGELSIVVAGFDPIAVPASGRIILRPEGQGVVLRET